LKESQGFDMGRSFKDTQRKEGKFVCKGSKLEELICKTKQIEASDLVCADVLEEEEMKDNGSVALGARESKIGKGRKTETEPRHWRGGRGRNRRTTEFRRNMADSE
jgi:hypothetical protein